MAKHTVVCNADITDFTIGESVDIVCCDCGLTHTAIHEIKDGVLKIQWWRNDRSTGQYRRHRQYPLLKAG